MPEIRQSTSLGPMAKWNCCLVLQWSTKHRRKWKTSIGSLVKAKYQDIHDKFVEHYPTPEEAKALGKEYPHPRTQMTKAILTSKLKIISIV